MGQQQKQDDSDMYLRKVFVGGVRPETSDQQFRQYFEAFGALDDCIHIRNKETKASKGFGFVTFSDNADVDKCLAAKPHNLNGKEVSSEKVLFCNLHSLPCGSLVATVPFRSARLTRD